MALEIPLILRVIATRVAYLSKIRRQCLSVNRVAVVLRCNVDTSTC